MKRIVILKRFDSPYCEHIKIRNQGKIERKALQISTGEVNKTLTAVMIP